MYLNVLTTVPFPKDRVFLAMRDQMPALAEYMPNVDSIIVESREDDDEDDVRLVNRWNGAATEIPVLARGFIDPKHVYWHDHARWLAGEALCHWRLEMGFMGDRIQCSGTTRYVPRGDDATEMRISGQLNLNLKGLVPRLLMGKATSAVEGFVGQLLKPNFQKTADALSAYLAANNDG